MGHSTATPRGTAKAPASCPLGHRSSPSKATRGSTVPGEDGAQCCLYQLDRPRSAHEWLQLCLSVGWVSAWLTRKAAQPVLALLRHLELPSDKAQKGNRAPGLEDSAARPLWQQEPPACKATPAGRAAAVQACCQAGAPRVEQLSDSYSPSVPNPAKPYHFTATPSLGNSPIN